jgi:hypothetical protein
VRSILWLFGLAGLGGGLYLVYDGARLTHANLGSGAFSLRAWEAVFWLRRPPQLEHGLTDNARAWLLILGGGMLCLLGWRLLQLLGSLGDE